MSLEREKLSVTEKALDKNLKDLKEIEKREKDSAANLAKSE